MMTTTMGKTRKNKKRFDPLDPDGKKRPNAIINEESYWLDLDTDLCSKIRNPKRLNARFKPRP